MTRYNQITNARRRPRAANRMMKTSVSFMIVALFIFSCRSHTEKGRPWKSFAQSVPGKIECEWYDEGGEGVAYHDTDAVNNGSGKLNPANGTFLNEFRISEAVDISYTKPGNVDDHAFNKVTPEMGKLYAGWTQPGEWINYTIDVKNTAVYEVALMYTANGDGVISLDVDGTPASGNLTVRSTNDPADTVAWRQWHHWNKAERLAKIALTKGTHRLTLRTIAHGNMNYDYFLFTKAD